MRHFTRGLICGAVVAAVLGLSGAGARGEETVPPKPVNLVQNGDFADSKGWDFRKEAGIIPSPEDPQKKCAKIEPGASISQYVSLKGGKVYRITWRTSGGGSNLNTSFRDLAGKEIPGRGYGEDTRGCYYFPFAASHDKWEAREQRLLAPTGAVNLVINFSPRAKEPTVHIANVAVAEERPIKLEKSKEENLIFEEHFDGFPEVEANGGRFRPALTKVDFVPGFKGNAARFSSESGIYYGFKGIMDKFDEGTVEVYAKMEWPKEGILTPYHEMGIFGAGGFSGITDRLALTFRHRSLHFRVSGSGKGQHSYATPELEGWHHFAITWKANQGQGTDFARLYLDGGRIINIDYIPITYVPKDPAKMRFSVGAGPEGVICMIDEMKIYNVAKEYSAVEME